MGSSNRQFTDYSIGARKRATTVRGRTYQYEPCNGAYPVLGASPYALPTGATGTVGRVNFPGGEVLMHYKGAGQSLLGPTYDAASGKLSVGLDQTSTEGVEYLFGSATTGALGRHAYTGADPLFGRISVTLADVSGLSEFAFGLRESEAFQAAFDSYSDFAAVNVQGGVVRVETNLAGAGTVTTAQTPTWADGETHEIKYIVGRTGAGSIELFFDGAPLDAKGYALASAVITASAQPYLFILYGATLPDDVILNEFEFGRLRDVERGV